MQQPLLFIAVCMLIALNAERSSVFDESGRVQELYLRRTFRDLRIREHSHVADIGAGSGWLTTRLAAFVGPKGQVYAVDVLPRSISYIEEIITTKKLNNTQAILSSATDPKLPKKTLDAAVILIAYHEFEKPHTMLTKIRQAMKKGARLGVIDRDSDQMRTKAREAYAKTGYIEDRVNETLADQFLVKEHYIAMDIVVREVKSVGFKFLFSRELRGDYYLAVFLNP